MIKARVYRGIAGVALGVGGMFVMPIEEPNAPIYKWPAITLVVLGSFLALYWWGIYQLVKAKGRDGSLLTLVCGMLPIGTVVLLLLEDRAKDGVEKTASASPPAI